MKPKKHVFGFYFGLILRSYFLYCSSITFYGMNTSSAMMVLPCDCSLQWLPIQIDKEVGPFPVRQGQNAALEWPQCVRIQRCIGTCGRSLIEARLFVCVPERRFLVGVEQSGQVVSFDDHEWKVQVVKRRVKLESHSGCICQRKLPDFNKTRRRNFDFSNPFSY